MGPSPTALLSSRYTQKREPVAGAMHNAASTAASSGSLGDQAASARSAGDEQHGFGRASGGDEPGGQQHGRPGERTAQQRHREDTGTSNPPLCACAVDRAREGQVHDEVLGSVAQLAPQLAAERVNCRAGVRHIGGGRGRQVGLHVQGDSAQGHVAGGECSRGDDEWSVGGRCSRGNEGLSRLRSADPGPGRAGSRHERPHNRQRGAGASGLGSK